MIDFDDSGFGWHHYDLAVALIAYQDHPDFAVFRDACIAGYRSVRAMADADLALLPMFLLIRDMAQIGWFHQRPELPRAAVLPRLKAAHLRQGWRTSSCRSETRRIAFERKGLLWSGGLGWPRNCGSWRPIGT